MDIVQYFDTIFWETATNVTKLLVPIIAVFILFRILHDLLWR